MASMAMPPPEFEKREPGRRFGFDRGRPAASAGQDRFNRRRALLQALMAWARGKRRVRSMIRAPSPEEEDRRSLTRERGTGSRNAFSIPIGLGAPLSGQGIRDYNPLRRDRC